MKSTGVRSSTELHRLHLNIGHQDSSSSNDQQGYKSYWSKYLSAIGPLHNDKQMAQNQGMSHHFQICDVIPFCDEFDLRNMNIYMYFLSFIITYTVQVVLILACGRRW